MLQAGDLRRRRQRYPNSNKMLIVYEVLPTNNNSGLWKRQPLILDLDQVQNLASDVRNSGQEFVKGRPLGFCEITQRPYGLGGRIRDDGSNKKKKNDEVNSENNENDAPTSLQQKLRKRQERLQKQKQKQVITMRPVLTNLAVSLKARKSGIGSKLVEECEQHVMKRWNQKEIILEVEDFNEKALNFYKKRGYNVLFSDPASRRYDVTGVLLKKIRCTREIMRKSLSSPFQSTLSSPSLKVANNNDVALELIQKIRDTVGVFN